MFLFLFYFFRRLLVCSHKVLFLKTELRLTHSKWLAPAACSCVGSHPAGSRAAHVPSLLLSKPGLRVAAEHCSLSGWFLFQGPDFREPGLKCPPAFLLVLTNTSLASWKLAVLRLASQNTASRPLVRGLFQHSREGLLTCWSPLASSLSHAAPAQKTREDIGARTHHCHSSCHLGWDHFLSFQLKTALAADSFAAY